MNFFIPMHCFHNDAKYFPNPNLFDPDRFNEENRKNIDPDTYLPFGELLETFELSQRLQYFDIYRSWSKKLHRLEICFDGAEDDFLQFAAEVQLRGL